MNQRHELAARKNKAADDTGEHNNNADYFNHR
jgi:hypothetical protein